MPNITGNSRQLPWRVHTPNLLKEIQHNKGMEMMGIPLQIFADLLAKVAERCAEIADPQLNQLMLRLALYEQGDPESPEYAPEAFDAGFKLVERKGR